MRQYAEKQIIGQVFAYSETVEKFCTRLKPDEFKYYPEYAQAITELHAEGKGVNYLTVGGRMAGEDHDRYSKVTMDLMDLSADCGLPSDFDKAVMYLFECILRDRIQMTGLRISHLTEEDDVFDHLEGVDELVLDMVGRLKDGGYKPRELLKAMSEMETGSLTYGLPIGVSVALTNLVIVAARPSMGKTSFAVRAALNTARMGLPICFASREMSKEEITARAVSLLSRIPYSRIVSKDVRPDEEEKFHSALSEFLALPFYVIEPPSDCATAIAKIKEKIARDGVKAVFADYLQLFEGTGDNREQRVANVAQQFKALAKDTRTPVMLLSQLSREVEKRSNKMPQLSDLRESGAIEQHADIVIMLCRPEYYQEERGKTSKVGDSEYPNEDLLVVGVEKYRNGPTGRRAMKWIGQYMDVADYE